VEITEELTQKVYSELEKHVEGDIDTLRTLLITLLVATFVGLSEDLIEQHVMRIVNLADKNREVKPNETGK
jgi:hypothetical protein